MRLRLILGLLVMPVVSAAGQVGFMPEHSPYREIEHGSFLELTGGHVYGGGGLLDLGPRNGTSEGLRWALRAKNTLQFSLGFWTANTVRTQIDQDDSVATRNKGLVPERLIAAEFGIQLNLSGGKTWHQIAPYAGVGVGFVNGQGPPPTDTSGYAFGTKFYFAPTIGTRVFAGQRLYLKVDVRALVWNLQYPPSYALEPTKQPGTVANPNAVNPTGATSQYTVTPEIRIGIGFVP
jgi:hypothetical protein